MDSPASKSAPRASDERCAPFHLSAGFSSLDWFVLAAYAAVLLGIGFYYLRQQRGTNDEFFVGNRRTHPLLAGLSMFMATTSIITYIGTPGESVQYGPVLVYSAAALFPLVAACGLLLRAVR